jgi:hypothetical protein
MRFRRRLAGYVNLEFARFHFDDVRHIIKLIVARTGADVKSQGGTFDTLTSFFISSEVIDLLDSITIVADGLSWIGQKISSVNQLQYAKLWVSFVRTALSEENLNYHIDDNGVVHPFIDQEFEKNRTSALDALASERFCNARHDFEEAMRHLRNGEGKQAIRMLFPAVESAAKVLVPGSFARLMPNEVDRYFRPKLEEKYKNNELAIIAGQQLLDGFKCWIIASQQYRHGQPTNDMAEPPTDFLVAYLSSGATYLRWIIELNE